MTIIEAFKTGRAIRRKNKSWSYVSPGWFNERTYIFPDTWIDPGFFVSNIHMQIEDILATDWQVKPKKKVKKK